ncbi:MAG: class I SAM-dependent methyltransferase [Gammaproteobacteria bacterium]|nr:class I SAM-dependent methyltransferase [Gammaproteobacteria bacterium]
MKTRIGDDGEAQTYSSSKYMDTSYDLLSDWYSSSMGLKVFNAEKRKVQQIIAGLVGFNALQLGLDNNFQLIDMSSAANKIMFCPNWRDGNKTPVANIEELPLATESIDIIVIYHALDFTPDSHKLLREATRVLKSGGSLIIVGFNPLSLWGLVRSMTRKREIPWSGRFIPLKRLSEWLSLLTLCVDFVDHAVHFLPFSYERLLRRADKFEQIGSNLKSPFGASYIVHCVKHTVPITPLISKRWSLRSVTGAFPVTENVRIRRY